MLKDQDRLNEVCTINEDYNVLINLLYLRKSFKLKEPLKKLSLQLIKYFLYSNEENKIDTMHLPL